MVVGLLQRAELPGTDADAQHHRMPDVVENDHLVGDQHRGSQPIEARLRLRQPLKLADRLVTEITDRAAEERRQLRNDRRADSLQKAAQRHERPFRRIELALPVRIGIIRPALFDAENTARIEPDERITAETLARLDALEQEDVFVVNQPGKHRDRRLEVRDQLPDHRNQIRAFRQALELFECLHDFLPVL